MHKPKRFLAGLLALVLIFGCVGPIHAVEAAPAGEPETTQQSLSFREIDGSQVQGLEQNVGEAPSTYSMGQEDPTEPSEPYTDDTVVRVSVVLEKPSTLEAGFPADGIADNEEAMAYRRSLKVAQNKLLPRIQELAGDKFELVHQLTLAANLISVNVPYGTLDDIRALEGVKDVEIETEYAPDFGETTAEPNMSTSSSMIGSSAAWASGYTGAGTRIAVIDTGLDTDHQSFSQAGYDYALEKLAAAKGMALEEYEASLHMLTQEDVANKLDLLNIADNTGVEADRLYLGSKVPFAYNYVDKGFDVTHDNDTATEHGSHVAGIAAANRYIPEEDGSFADALETVHVQGVAPDAQILVMKVFDKNGGANDSDYMAAIEDAIILGADAINLSLGSANPGFSRCYKYQAVMDALQNSGVVVTISAGNSGYWAEYSNNGTGLLYGDDVSFATNGSPGSYTNAFTVASADNTGTTAQYIGVNDNQDKIFYLQSLGYGNEDLVTLAGDRDYVLIDGVGTKEQIDALGDEVLKGKIAVCSRGENAFTEKAANALAHGAVALVVYNNVEGSFGMNLTGYAYTAPCVAITQQEGDLLRSAATAVTDSEGNVLYYRGTMTVSADPAVQPGAADAPVTMSSFSSWGVPGSLELKPEITAPGGNIYSVNGQVKGGKAYENMSGTSMAAPQVAGLTALAAQYIRGCGIPEGSDFTARQLAQSLLMSTAKPVTDSANGGYYSVMQQGAGLADISKVLSARSYVTMGSDATKSWADGKVKAELGDDPQRTGSYTFSFDLRNITKEDQKFVLSADLFTQAMREIDGTDYLDTATADLAFLAGWTVDGTAVETDPALLHMDFNGDGAVNEKDAEAILDLVTGKRDSLNDQENADLNGDGAITAFDAHLFLVKLSDSPIQVAAGKTAHVTVTLRLTDSQKAALDENYVNGTYIEGFVFATELANAEGVEGTVHSIPVLGFYGNWSDPSMYDKGTYAGRFYGDETLPYTGELYTNSLMYMAPGDKTYKNELGNPYLVEETYPEEKVAIRSTDIIYGYGLSLIRNPAALVLTVEDLDTNEMLYCTPPAIQAYGAYYHTNGGTWMATYGEGYVNATVQSLGAKEGDRIRVSAVSVPEYYETDGNLTKDGVVELIQSGKLGKGATISTDLWVDDTAPTMTGIVKDLATGDLTVSVQDNQYVAAVAILNARGTKVYTYSGVEQSEMGAETSATFDLSDVTIGPECLVEVADYAGNERYYTVNYGGAPEDYTGKMYGFTNSAKRGGDRDDTSKNPRWMSFDPATLWYDSVTLQYGGSQIEAHMDYNVTAGEYVDGYVYMAAADGFFYAAPQGEWEYARKVGRYSNVTKTIRDMAFNTADKKLYALDANNTIYSVDLVTGAMTKEYSVSIQHPISNAARYKPLEALAIDDNGTFYAVSYGSAATNVYGQEYPCYSYLFSWTNGDAVDGKVENVTCVGGENNHGTGYTSATCTQSMAWDHDADVLYWANATNASGSTSSFLLKFDLTNGTAERVNTTYATDSEGVEHDLRMASKTYINIAGLYVVPGGSAAVGPTEQALDITISETEKTLLKGSAFTLTTEVFPWNLKDYSVSWSTSNASVATVEDGLVRSVGAGEAVITATTNAAPHLTAECHVTVKELPDTKLSAVIFAADNNPYWAEFHAPDPAGWTAVSGVTGNFFGGTMADGMIYATDGSAFYAVDPDTFESKLLLSDVGGWAWSDACPSPKSQGISFGTIATACQQGQCFDLVDPESGMITWYWDMSQGFGQDPLAVVAFHRSGTYSYSYITDAPANYYYALSEGGELWEFVAYTQDEGGSFSLAVADLGNVGLDLTGVSKISGSYASMYYDEASGYLLVSAYLNGSEAKLYAVDLDTMLTAEVGSFGENVWPVASLYQYDRIQDLTVLLKPGSVKLDAKDTAQLEAKVRPATFVGGITWTSSDPTVATVDENGLVTAVAQGIAVITATSVDVDENGNHATARCTVEVKDLADVDAVVKAQLTDENGSYWAEINTKTLETRRLADASTTFYAGGASDGVIYGSTCNFKDNGKLYAVDPSNGYAETKGGDCLPDYAPIDMSDAPLGRAVYQADNEGGTTVKEVFGFPALLSYYQNTYLLSDYTTGELTQAGIFPTSYYYNKLAAIAYIGGGSNAQGYPYRSYMVLEADGHLHKFTITADYYYYWQDTMSYSLDREEYGRIDLRLQDYAALSMTYVENNGKPGLVIADSAGGATLYYVDISGETPVANKIGTLDGIGAITTLYTDVIAPTNDNPVDAGEEGTQQVLPGVEGSPEIQELPETEAQAEETYPGGSCLANQEVENFEQAAPAAAPRTGSVTPQAVSAVQANESGLTKAATAYVVKPVSADGSAAASVGGLVTIRFDAKKMTLENFQTAASCVSVVDDRDNGVLTIAYADLDPVDRIVTLNFAGNCGANGDITVEHRQRNEKTLTYTQTIGVEHSFGAWTVTKAPTATEPGVEIRTCSVCGATESRELPATDPKCPSKAFTDLSTTAWYHEYVDYVLAKGIMVGNGNGTFGPNNNVTRAQMVTMLYGLAGRPIVDGSKALPFTDVSADAWYANALRWAYQNGIAAGTSATTFTLNANVSREQMVSFLARYAKLAGKYEKASADLSKFTDGASVSSYAAESMEWAIANGFVSGTGNGKLDPKSTATRAQIAVVLTKYCQKLD